MINIVYVYAQIIANYFERIIFNLVNFSNILLITIYRNNLIFAIYLFVCNNACSDTYEYK